MRSAHLLWCQIDRHLLNNADLVRLLALLWLLLSWLSATSSALSGVHLRWQTCDLRAGVESVQPRELPTCSFRRRAMNFYRIAWIWPLVCSNCDLIASLYHPIQLVALLVPWELHLSLWHQLRFSVFRSDFFSKGHQSTTVGIFLGCHWVKTFHLSSAPTFFSPPLLAHELSVPLLHLC